MSIDMETIKKIFEEGLKAAMTNDVKVSIDLTEDAVSIWMEPSKPFEMKCPYGKE